MSESSWLISAWNANVSVSAAAPPICTSDAMALKGEISGKKNGMDLFVVGAGLLICCWDCLSR
jgi:hypothetical protein